MQTIKNNYLIQALDKYPYDLPEAIEKLNYALAYNQEDALALCLLGRVHAEQFKQYEKAKDCFASALAIDDNELEIYGHYIRALIANGEFSEAVNLVDYALSKKGILKVEILVLKSLALESQLDLKKALKTIKEAYFLSTDDDWINAIEAHQKRIEKKIELKRKKVNA